jgi:hypothetical protein
VKRLVVLFLVVALLLAFGSGCGGGAEDRYKNSGRDKPKAAEKVD